MRNITIIGLTSLILGASLIGSSFNTDSYNKSFEKIRPLKASVIKISKLKELDNKIAKITKEFNKLNPCLITSNNYNKGIRKLTDRKILELDKLYVERYNKSL